jgi:hypothetical protein
MLGIVLLLLLVLLFDYWNWYSQQNFLQEAYLKECDSLKSNNSLQVLFQNYCYGRCLEWKFYWRWIPLIFSQDVR